LGRSIPAPPSIIQTNKGSYYKRDGADAFAIIFDGRNGGGNGIDGRMIFVAGGMPSSHDAVGIFDAANVRIPLICSEDYRNMPLLMEGCENVTLGVIAALAGDSAMEPSLQPGAFMISMNAQPEPLTVAARGGLTVAARRGLARHALRLADCKVGLG